MKTINKKKKMEKDMILVENGLQVYYEVLAENYYQSTGPNPVSAIDTIFIMICLPDSPQEKMFNNHFEPCLFNLKQISNHKEKITPETYYKNL